MTNVVSDIVERLRDPAFGTETSERNLMNQAADRIAQLEAALRELLEADDNLRELMPRWVSEALIEGALIRVRTAKDKARAALEERT